MIRTWLKDNGLSLGVLTGTDSRALDAAVHIIELYSLDNDLSILDAFGAIVRRMQPTARYLAYHAIACIMDWSDRRRLWDLAGLDDCNPPRCVHEPNGKC